MPVQPVRGRFLWHELMTSDTKSAAAFYTKVVDWKTQAWDQDPSYTMFTAKRRPMAGLMALPEADTPLMWLPYIGTPNVDETARQAERLGGKVLKRAEDIPTIGRFAIIQDPQGAIFAAFTPLQNPSASDEAPAIGDFSWHELLTTDWPSAFAFYEALFGWVKTESMDMGPEMGTYQMYGWKGRTLGGMFDKPKQSPGPPRWLAYMNVPDAKKAATTAKQLGGRITSGPMEVPGGGWIATGLDLQGAAFAVHAAPAATKARAAARTARRVAATTVVKKRAPSKKKNRPTKKKPVRKMTRTAKRKSAGSQRKR